MQNDVTFEIWLITCFNPLILDPGIAGWERQIPECLAQEVERWSTSYLQRIAANDPNSLQRLSS